MKKLVLLIIAITLFSCGSSEKNCAFSKLEMTNQIGDGEIKKGTFDASFSVSEPDALGIIEVTADNNLIKVTFDKTGDMLNIKGDDNKLVEYRRKLGHQIMITQKKDSLIIVYGDINGANSKSSLLFTK